MKITHLQIQFLYNWLNTPLHGEEARSRNKFIKIIQKQYQDSLDGRTTILKKHADKDKDGEAILEEGRYKMSDKVTEKAKQELNDFLETSVEYKPTKTDKVHYKTVKSILTNAKLGLDIASGEVYDDIMTQFDSVK